MKDESLNHLSKEELIEIVLSDDKTRSKAFRKVNQKIAKKIENIIEQQEKCNILTPAGRAEHERLEKQYKKWDKIQANLQEFM